MTDTDNTRRLENIIRPGSVAEVDLQATPPAVRVESGGLLTDWLPWAERCADKTRTWHPAVVGEQCVLLCPSGDPATGFVIRGFFSNNYPPPSTSPDEHVCEYPDGARVVYNHADSKLEISGVKIVNIEGSDELTATGFKNVTLQNGDSLTVSDYQNVSINDAKKIKITSSEIDINCPNTTFTGNVTVIGLLSYIGGLSGGAGASGDGGAFINGPLKVINHDVTVRNGDVIAGLISLLEHLHPGISRGDEKTDKPV